ncbi:MAG TPA: 4-(cytidine 5'-diphospho)-2-C-methyl-D-erythritol kinase [Clostridia bacterium]|nr:4-(cytidine 5'-diphospho)-2-C-methyl-D-erythritol kinase [Clostridia bacterium]
MKITVKAAAKINLHLDILATLKSGYHSLFMIMQSVSLYDLVTIEKISSGIELTCSAATIPCDKTNIAHKAAVAFFDLTGIKGGARIHIDKRIPFSAGLAGGSADGAAVIASLNKLYCTGLNDFELGQIGIKVGADVPFCISGGTMLAQDIGGVLSPLPDLKKTYIVLAKPECSVSTKLAYKAFDECEYVRHPKNAIILNSAVNGDFDGICKYAHNVFEQFIEVPERVEIKRIMHENNVRLCQMSGSGPTVFGLFDSKQGANSCVKALEEIVNDIYVCECVSSGLEFC